MPTRLSFLPAVVATLLAGLVPRTLPAAPPSAEYKLLFAEEFDGTNLNESVWGYRVGARTNGYIQGFNYKQNVSVADGSLHIACRAEKRNGRTEHTGGGVIGRIQLGYGYYESRSKPFMAGRGVHSAYWQAGGAVPNNQIFEIDGYEIDSKSWVACNNLYVHLAPKGMSETPWPHRAQIPFTLDKDGWFVDAYDYSPDGVTFYDNGKVVARVDFPGLTAAQVVWLTALNGCGRVDESTQPNETLFDYFRYYARDYPGVNLLPNGAFEYNLDKIDPAKPVAWVVAGDKSTCRVIADPAPRDSRNRHVLRLGRDQAAFATSLSQRLEYIRNGTYTLTTRVRSSGDLKTARLHVAGTGADEKQIAIPKADAWTPLRLDDIAISNNHATLSIEVDGAPGQWVELDDIQFLKPAKAGTPPPRPLVLSGDPVWALAQREPITFTGDAKFYFFDRCVGFGDAMSVAFTMTPRERADMSPIARIPAKGKQGWAVLLTKNGDVVFRVGSGKDYADVIASAVYEAGKPVRVACVFDTGTASIHVDGVRKATRSGIRHGTRDATQAGKVGSVGNSFNAVTEVIAEDAAQPRALKTRNYVGTLGDIRVHNRALRPEEIAR